jgi:DNA polymerase III delta prime subunit
MKIKNIQEYRSFYKNAIRDQPTRDENFIGNFLVEKETGKKKFGWFEIYHGDKEGYGKAESGIENFLQSFLDMAKDGQAVYEFLQNAVDAGSTHYSMVWGKDEVDGNHYLLVANNGKMFNLDSIRSILNVGSSTKTSDSQTIGKFGIGFKLAHRLVGRDNGLQELINENSGPILFSWKNYEIAQLADTESIEPEVLQYAPKENGNYEVLDDNPWLFKILITCFPCLPQNNAVVELPKMANGVQATTNPFGKTEYEVLSRWVKKNQKILNKETYNEGALFFIKLGSGKEEELAEENLREGVKFAIAILKETAPDDEKDTKLLKTVQLNNDEPITYPDLEYIKLSINKENDIDTYAHIRFGVNSYEDLTIEHKRRIAEEANIEALFGFRKHNEIGEFFKGAPNLYLYFPLSEEVHNFNYILHSNAFYKGASRTFLHKGGGSEDGINERLLKVIVAKIEDKLTELSGSEKPSDKSLFLHFYAALLTSGKSTNQDRLWIETPYINPINKLLEKYIPVRNLLEIDDYTIVTDSIRVFIKKTDIGIDINTWGLTNVNWFYWNAEDEAIISKSIEKLGIEDYTIFNLLVNEGIDNHINAWLNSEDERINIILSELALFKGDKALIDKIKPQLLKLNLFKFSNGESLSLSQFLDKESEGYFLLHNTLGDVNDILIKAGLITTTIDLNTYKFVDIFRTYLLQASKHKGYTELTQLFSLCVKDENLVKLSKSEKIKLFNAFRTFNSDNVTERIKELKLFNNNLGKPVAFKSLLSNQPNSWLNTFSISINEYDDQLKSFLLDDRNEVYQNIIYPYWANILEYIVQDERRTNEVITEIAALFNESKWAEKQQHLLSNQDLIIYKSEVLKSDKVFFNESLCLLSDEEFTKVQTIGFKFYGLHIPDKYLIIHLDELPLSYSSSNINAAIENIEVSIDEINDLMLLSSKCNVDFFEVNSIVSKDNKYVIDSTSGLKQFSTSKPSIESYITKYHPNQFVLIPEGINLENGKIKLSDSALVVHLIELFSEETIEQELDLIELVINERYDDKKTLLNALTYIRLDTSWAEERQNELYLKLLNDVFTDSLPVEELSIIQNKLVIYENKFEVIIGEIDSAQDTIEVKRGDRTIYLSQAQILNLENADTIKLIQGFHDAALCRNLINPRKANILFKISKVGISDELKNKFIECLTNNQIENSHQLLFVCLSGKFDKDNFGGFKLLSQDSNWISIKGVLIINTNNNLRNLNPVYLINERYVDLQDLLHLSDLEVFNYGENENDIIAAKFLFAKGLNPDLLNGGGELIEKLDYLYDGWINLPHSIREYKKNAEWERVLGLIPNQYVINGIHTDNELLPEGYTNWCQNDKAKLEFLKALGVNVADSYIESLRLFLLTEKISYSNEIDVRKFNTTLLLNTLNGLAGDFTTLNKSPFIYSEVEYFVQIQEIEKIINYLIDNNIECPFLVYNDIDSYKLVKQEEISLCKIEETIHIKLKQDKTNNLNLVYSEYYVLKETLLHNEKIKESITELVFEREFETSLNPVPHNEPFYHNWSKQHNVILIKEDVLKFKIYVNSEGEKQTIGTIVAEGYYQWVTPEGITIVNYTKSIHLDGLKSFLSADSNPLESLISGLISKRDLMLASIYNAYNSASKDDVSSEHLQALQDAFREENLKQERQDLISNIKGNTKYSYTWFISYLEYLLTFSKNSSDNNRQKTIRFHSIKRQVVNSLLSNKYFLLCGASSYINDSIEEVSDFSLSVLLKNNKRFDIGVEGAQKQGQDLLIFCPNGINNEIAENFDAIFQLEITFIPQLDLLKELKNALANRNNIDIWDDVNSDLPNLQFIYGPPGTGKTTALCSKIMDEVKQNPNTRYLFLTPTNKAADVLCKKLLKPSSSKIDELKQENNYLSVYRIGKPTDPEIESLELDVYQDSVQESLINIANVLAMTIHRLPYTKVFDSNDDSGIKLFKLENHWDYVVFDEASMINLPYIVFAILSISKFSPNAKFIIAGDPKQIPPVVDVNDKELEELDIQDENIYSMMNIKSFNETDQVLRINDSIENLKVQYRSVKKIGQLFSELSYGNLLEHHRETTNNTPKQLPDAFQKLVRNNVMFIDIPLNNEDSIYKIRQLFYSSYHIYSAILVSEIIKFFDTTLSEGENWSIGLIAPYKAQAVMMNKLIASFGISNKLKIYADTVHGFQGDECDIVFFISNPNNYRYTGHPKCLLSKEYIYNVAISRAKDYLIILHPFSEISDNPFINSIKSSYHSNFEKPIITEASDFEKILFNSNSFIYDNSFITGHDTVNVFGQLEKKYFIKANLSAIDIQLRKLN